MKRTWPENGWPKMGHAVDEMVPIAQLEAWADEHIDLDEYAEDAEYMAMLEADIREKGFINPLVVKVGRTLSPMIVEGHHRLLAAKRIGLEELPVAWQKSGAPGWKPDLAELKRRLMR